MNERNIQNTKEKLKFQKDLAFLRSWLLGKEWWVAHDALEFALNLHSGMRKDGMTPEFHHQVQIALNARTLSPYFIYPEATLAPCFLHDVLEDFDDIEEEQILKKFGKQVIFSSELLAKKRRGEKKTYQIYFEGISEDAVASIVKGLDRCHNIWTMRGVFPLEKRVTYVREIDEWFLPMLKKARKNFPQQEPAYQNIAQQLRSMRDIYQWAHCENANKGNS